MSLYIVLVQVLCVLHKALLLRREHVQKVRPAHACAGRGTPAVALHSGIEYAAALRLLHTAECYLGRSF